MWDLPRPGLEPVSPASAGRLSTTAPPGKPLLIFFEPLLSVYITSGLECLWLIKERGKVTDGNIETTSMAGFKILLCANPWLTIVLHQRVDWSNPWVVIRWLEKTDTLWACLVLQLLLLQGAPVCTLPRGYPGYRVRCVCYVWILFYFLEYLNCSIVDVQIFRCTSSDSAIYIYIYVYVYIYIYIYIYIYTYIYIYIYIYDLSPILFH